MGRALGSVQPVNFFTPNMFSLVINIKSKASSDNGLNVSSSKPYDCCWSCKACDSGLYTLHPSSCKIDMLQGFLHSLGFVLVC